MLLGEPKECRLLLQARRQKADAEQELTRLFEWLSLEDGVGTVAGRAQTRRTSLNDVSITHGRQQRSSNSAATTAVLEGRNAYLPVESLRPPWSGASDDGLLHRRTAVVDIGHIRPACGNAKIQPHTTEEQRAKIASQWQQMHQNIIGCEFRHWIRNPRAKVPPVTGNMLSWPATAADH